MFLCGNSWVCCLVKHALPGEVGKGACLVCHRLNFAWQGDSSGVWLSWSGFFWNGWSDNSADLCLNFVCSWFRSLRDQSDGRTFAGRMSQRWAVNKSSQNEHFWTGTTPAAHNNSTFCLLFTSVNVFFFRQRWFLKKQLTKSERYHYLPT